MVACYECNNFLPRAFELLSRTSYAARLSPSEHEPAQSRYDYVVGSSRIHTLQTP